MGLGYQGYVSLINGGNSNTLLATGGGLNMVLEPIYSTAVWGAGWYNASTGHYADGALRYEGAINAEMQDISAVWNFIRNWAIEQRAYGQSIDYSPDGHNLFQYHATNAGVTYDNFGVWLKGLTLHTNSGSFVTADLDCLALHRVVSQAGMQSTYISNKNGIIGSNAAAYGATCPLNPGGNNLSPVPFWKTNAAIVVSGSAAAGQALDWNISVQNSPVVLYTCSGVREATAVLMGAIDATASTTFYNDGGVFDPIVGPAGGSGTPNQPYSYAQNTSFVVTINPGGGAVTITMPAVVIGSDAYNLGGISEAVTRAFNMKGLATCPSTTVVPPVLMSVAS